MFNTLTIDFQDLVAPKGAVLCVVKYTRYFTRKIVPRTSLATAAPLSSCCSWPGCSAEVFCDRQPPDLARIELLGRGGRGPVPSRRPFSILLSPRSLVVCSEDSLQDGRHRPCCICSLSSSGEPGHIVRVCWPGCGCWRECLPSAGVAVVMRVGLLMARVGLCVAPPLGVLRWPSLRLRSASRGF